MPQFLTNLLTASIHGSVAIGAVMVLRLLLRRTPRKYICLLWLLAGIRLLLPVQVRSELSLQPSFSLPWTGYLPGFLPWIWGAVALCFGLYSLVSYFRLKARVREAVRIRGGWESDRIHTAFILGFIRPRIYIPMGMDPQARAHILSHERTHLDKGDHWIKMIGFLALALHWFNPLVWAAYFLLCKDIELACDERVVQFMELEERKSYSSALLCCSSPGLGFAGPVAFGEVSVKQRILTILNYRKPGFWISLLGVLAFFFVALCLVTSPPADPAEPLTPEQQAQADAMARARAEVETALTREEFFYEIYTNNTQGDTLWYLQILRLGEDTLWMYTPTSYAEITEGRMERLGKHYAWVNGGWVETEAPDDRFESWLDIFRWDPATAEHEEVREDTLIFTTRWEGEDRTVHTATVHYWAPGGTLQGVWVEQPNWPDVGTATLSLDPAWTLYEGKKTVEDFFLDAEAKIREGTVTASQLADQAEIDRWGIHFRVDDDRLTSRGADVSFSQDHMGFGTVSTTDKYFLERKVEGVWQEVPLIAEPLWANESLGVAMGTATFGYLDWTDLYGPLEPGDYRMGKVFTCYDRETDYNKAHTFYSEFSIYESVDASSPEARAAVERCYTALDRLMQRTNLHWRSVTGGDGTMEYWVNGDDYVNVTYWPGPDVPQEQWSDHEKGLFPRTDTTVRYQGVGYTDLRADPEVPASEVLGMGVSTLAPTRAGWSRATIAEDFCISFFQRSNHVITFPEGVGVVSGEMVRFQTNWVIAGGMECDAVLTYRFDDSGELSGMEYSTDLGNGRIYTACIEIFPETADQIDAVIRSYTEELAYREFNWTQAKAKYTADAFDIRESGFVNTEVSPVTGPLDAARLAVAECSDLGEYLSLDIAHDDAAGMWRVTIESYADYQATYLYRDVYLADNGVTCLMVREGPLGYDEPRG